jgi:hypothetical protein
MGEFLGTLTPLRRNGRLRPPRHRMHRNTGTWDAILPTTHGRRTARPTAPENPTGNNTLRSRWTVENRQFVHRPKPAISSGRDCHRTFKCDHRGTFEKRPRDRRCEYRLTLGPRASADAMLSTDCRRASSTYSIDFGNDGSRSTLRSSGPRGTWWSGPTNHRCVAERRQSPASAPSSPPQWWPPSVTAACSLAVATWPPGSD